MTSCTATWRETDPKVGDLIHADFTWTDAEKHGSGIYCSMGIYNPNGSLERSYDEEVNATGSHTLAFVADATGNWTCLIAVWTGFAWLYCTDIVAVAPQNPASCGASWGETDPKVGNTIHADFEWVDARWNSGGEFYCDMGIYNPNGTLVAYYKEENDATGSHTLDFVANIAGQWTCVIAVWTGFAWLYCTDIVVVAPAYPTTCGASWRETDPKVGNTIHADFEWANAGWNSGGQFYCDMAIYNPNNTRVAYYKEENDATGSHTLDFVANIVGIWKCIIAVWTGFAWLYCTDFVAVTNGVIECTNPVGAEGQIDPCGVGYGNQPDATHKYECVGGTWEDRDYNPECVTLACEDHTTQSECIAANCFWYAKYFWEEPSCHDVAQDMLMAYLPFILLGTGATFVAAALVLKPKPRGS